MRKVLAGLALAAATTAIPAQAEVTASSESGFVASGSRDLPGVSPVQAWAELVRPQDWWSDAHSWSGDAANMTLDARAGGCFCEAIPADQAGSVEHMQVVHVQPGSLLVMRGSLGPLQGEALTGVLTVTLEPLGEGGTRLGWRYVVGGFARFALTEMAAPVDGVIGEQMGRLAARLSGSR